MARAELELQAALDRAHEPRLSNSIPIYLASISRPSTARSSPLGVSAEIVRGAGPRSRVHIHRPSSDPVMAEHIIHITPQITMLRT